MPRGIVQASAFGAYGLRGQIRRCEISARKFAGKIVSSVKE